MAQGGEVQRIYQEQTRQMLAWETIRSLLQRTGLDADVCCKRNATRQAPCPCQSYLQLPLQQPISSIHYKENETMDRDQQQLKAIMQRIFACVGDGLLDDATAAGLLDVESLLDVPNAYLLPPGTLRRAILSFEVHYPQEQEVVVAPISATENRLQHASEVLVWVLDLGGMVYVDRWGFIWTEALSTQRSVKRRYRDG